MCRLKSLLKYSRKNYFGLNTFPSHSFFADLIFTPLQGYFYGYGTHVAVYHKSTHFHAHLGCEVNVFADPETFDPLCPYQEALSPHVSSNFSSENPFAFFFAVYRTVPVRRNSRTVHFLQTWWIPTLKLTDQGDFLGHNLCDWRQNNPGLDKYLTWSDC